MRKSFTRAVAFLLSVVICIGLFPATSLAANPPSAWPKIDTLTKNEGATLSSTNNHTYDRTITSVEHTEYAELENGGSSEGMQTWIVGEIVLHIDDAMKSDFQYKLSANALNITLKDVPEDAETDLDNFCGVIFTAAAAEKVSNAFVGMVIDDCEVYYAYKIKIVVDQTFSYPVLQSLTVNNTAVLTGADNTTIPIGAVTFTNYAAAQDGTNADGDNVKISGEINIYITSALKEQQYTLSAEMFTAVFTNVSGYGLEGLIQGIFKSGQTSTISIYYAYLESDETMYCYTLNIVQGLPEDGMYLSDANGTRISPTSARISFIANKNGTYHYVCVDAASTDVPDRPNGGATMTAGENTFVISDLSEGAKKVYIWGKDEADNVSQPLIVTIPAKATEYSLTLMPTSAVTDGIFSITADGSDVSFTTKMLGAPMVTATGLYEGQIITVLMGNPYTDQTLTNVTLKPELTVTVDSELNKFTFTMPAANVTGAGPDWRTYEQSTETRYTLTGTSSTFDQTNKAGIEMGSVVFRDAETGNIIKQAKTGTRVTATPVPSTTANYMLEFQFTEWSDAEGFELTEGKKNDNPLTFTVENSDVSVQANFKPIGTLVTWGAEIDPPITASDVPVVSFGSNLMTSPYTFKAGQPASVSITSTSDNEWYARYEFLGWEITRDGQAVSELDTSQAVGTEGTPGYWTWAKFTVSGDNMSIIAKFRQRNWGAVNVSVNDSAMGSATATVNGKADVSQVFEDQTVTLTANPGERYMLEGWTVTDKDQQPIEVTTSADNANVATFVMPKKGGDVTAIANFKVNPDNASKDAVMTKAELYTYEEPKKLVASGSKEGTLFTITLASDVDTTHLSSMILKFECSQYATVKQKGAAENWPANGQACGMALNEEKIFTVIAEDGKATCDYTVKIVQQQQLSSEKAITGVELIYNGETFASGELNEAASTWTITLDDDIDPTILSKFGTMDIKMKITYNGASLAQEGGYNDAGQTSWSSGTISCGISPGSQKTFTVTAEDGTAKDYTIAITQPNVSGEPVLSNGNATRTSDTAATVTFTSSAAGSYYYKVVTSGAAEPDIDTSKSGNAAVAGSNTITLNNLTAGARDIYIVVKNAAGDVSNKLKIEIPAFGEDPDNPDNPDEGDFKITYTGPSGGKLVPSRTKANAGDVITVTVVPDAGMQMVAGSMKYTLGVAGGESTPITDGTFTMPSADVTLSCKWEAVKTSTDGITAFTIDGVAGVVDNTTNTISVVMAYGTDVTKLIPIISGNNIASISPASGQMVDFTNSVRYTVTLTDGTVKYYTVTVYVQEGTAADKMWDKLTDFYDQTPWWEYADHQVSTGRYPKYW